MSTLPLPNPSTDPIREGVEDAICDSIVRRASKWQAWEDQRRIRERGVLGLENALFSEVFLGLDLLPRTRFLGRVLASVSCVNPDGGWTGDPLAPAAEEAQLGLRPRLQLRPGRRRNGTAVDPDGVLVGHDVLVFVEAKGPRRSATCTLEQLSRQLVVLVREAQARGATPALLVVLDSPPPVRVEKRGRLLLEDAVGASLRDSYEACEGLTIPLDEVVRLVPRTLAWITWERIAEVVKDQIEAFTCEDDSVEATVRRTGRLVCEAIRSHRTAAERASGARRA